MTTVQPGRVRVARCYADHDREHPCPCHHQPDPEWTPSEPRQPCDHGWTKPRPGATTGGVHGTTHLPGVQSPDAEAKCPTCQQHARQLREART